MIHATCPIVTEIQDIHLGKRTQNISQIWIKKKKKKKPSMHLLSLLNVLEMLLAEFTISF